MILKLIKKISQFFCEHEFQIKHKIYFDQYTCIKCGKIKIRNDWE